MTYFTTLAEPRPCWKCQYWGGLQDNGVTSWCERPGMAPVVAQPQYGCAYWTREPGEDDEPGLRSTPAP